MTEAHVGVAGIERCREGGVIVDAHLDIGYNALLNGHNFLGDPAPGHLVSRGSLVNAGIGLVGATLMCPPAASRRHIESLGTASIEEPTALFYRTAREASLIAQAQIGYYRSVGLELIRDREGLNDFVRSWSPGKLAAVLLLEGADAIERPEQLGAWAVSGLRVIGLAWTRTRYAGGTGKPGGVTKLGRALLAAMDRNGLILDISHLAERAVADVFELWRGPIMASHSNSRELAPGDRQISDATMRELGTRGGVIGISFYGGHLKPTGPAGVEDIVNHVLHVAREAGGPEHVGIGSDLDGGFPAKEAAIQTMTGFDAVKAALRQHLSADQIEGVMGRNWLTFFGRSLPPRVGN
jgi:membrane dipeptidase